MDRLTEKTIGCFKYDLKDFDHKVGEFGTYDAFFAYSMAVKKLGEYEDAEEQKEQQTCAGCFFEGRVRPQKCSCCRRNPDMKDCYEVKT